MDGFWVGFEKRAEEKEPGYWARQKGLVRAQTSANLGGVIGVKDSKLIGDTLKKELTHGVPAGAVGAGAGALVGKLSRGRIHPGVGAAIGGLLGLSGGATVGQYKATRDYLADKGIKLKHLGFDAEFSPEARKKYIK